jgi:hypothetical protein
LPDDSKIHLAARDEVDDFFGVAGSNEEAYARMPRDESEEDVWEDVRADRRGNRERQFANDAVAELPHQCGSTADGLKRAVGMRKKRTSGGRQDHACMGSAKERRADLDLKTLQTRRQRRLADGQRQRSAPHVARTRDLDKALDLRKEQAAPPG